MTVSPLAYSGMTSSQSASVVGSDGWSAVLEDVYLTNTAATVYNERKFTVQTGAAERYYCGEKVRIVVHNDPASPVLYGYITGISDTALYIIFGTSLPSSSYLDSYCEMAISHCASPIGFPSTMGYACAWTSESNPQPVATSGGYFYVQGGVVYFNAQGLMSATIGTGRYFWSLPLPIEPTVNNLISGSAVMKVGANFYQGTPYGIGYTGKVVVFCPLTGGITSVLTAHTRPDLWANLDYIYLGGSYVLDTARTVP